MLALIATSYFHGISLTLAMCPCDFIMEGFYQDGKDGIHERPDNHESSVSSVSVGHHAAEAFQIIGSIYVQGNKGFSEGMLTNPHGH